MDDADLTPTPCTEVYNAAYCIKLTGRYEGTKTLNHMLTFEFFH